MLRSQVFFCVILFSAASLRHCAYIDRSASVLRPCAAPWLGAGWLAPALPVSARAPRWLAAPLPPGSASSWLKLWVWGLRGGAQQCVYTKMQCGLAVALPCPPSRSLHSSQVFQVDKRVLQLEVGTRKRMVTSGAATEGQTLCPRHASPTLLLLSYAWHPGAARTFAAAGCCVPCRPRNESHPAQCQDQSTWWAFLSYQVHTEVKRVHHRDAAQLGARSLGASQESSVTTCLPVAVHYVHSQPEAPVLVRVPC